MSMFFNSLFKLSPSYGNRLMFSLRGFHTTQVQQLYSLSSLGVDGYLQTRKRIREQFSNFSDKFRVKMQDFVSDSKNMIFTEDLKNMIHIAEPADLNLVLEMIKKFNTQKTEFRFGSFVFGPIVMRMFHFLDAPNEALQCFEDPDNDGFFDQLVSYQILLDLLYNHEMYDDMYKVFQRVQEKQLNMTKYPKYPFVLIMAACYRQNSPQSFEYAKKLWSEMVSVGTVPLRRTATFMAALALNQGAPHLALESLALQKQHYVTVRNIRAIALAELGRIDEALTVLRGVLDIDQPDQKDKHTFFEDTINKVREAVEKADNKDVKQEFENIENALKDRQLIDKQTMDQLLTSDIIVKQTKPDRSSPRGMPKMPYGMRQKTKNLS
ncbi:pentatricopeptide repeat-containing protein 2, mitochondrial-like [Melitaea cinxia]|uniref:pentatricopeptide repeat-containing protein 2, mitochondrial-like n=1 Tax=Melitaea cinxia TaxID=113334 RepID=UPI001E273766|nr:pentatricopeptide repeat-containing protein 2, mitochondrial-like [Melitaea cinxia]